MRYSNDFSDYELIDMADGQKLERWGKYILIRPDPQIVWTTKTHPEEWKKANARYIRSSSGGGHWEKLRVMNDIWRVSYKNLTFNLKPMGFKHTGLFPEQAVNWDYMIDKITKATEPRKRIRVLNLFAYTGGATVACAYAGAEVVHVDSSAGIVGWAKENITINNLQDRIVRFLVDDVIKFVKREVRRGSKYDVIIMDPPSYGRGKNGEVWTLEDNIYELLELCNELLSDSPLFIMVNTYTGGFSGTIIGNALRYAIKRNNLKISSDEIGLKQKDSDIFLPCGVTTICEFDKE